VYVTIVHPASQAYVAKAAMRTGAAAAARDDEKRLVYANAGQPIPAEDIRPFSVETSGRLSPAAAHLLRELASLKFGVSTSYPRTMWITHQLQAVAAALHRGSARAYNNARVATLHHGAMPAPHRPSRPRRGRSHN